MYLPSLSLTLSHTHTHTHIHTLINLFFLNGNKMLILDSKDRSKTIPLINEIYTGNV